MNRSTEKNREYFRHWYAKNHGKAHARTRAYNRRMVWRVLDCLGGKCTCCGESEKAYLQIDHINNDGAAHRREIGPNMDKLRRLILADEHRAERYQLLCANCHFAKSYRNGCPHKFNTELQLLDMRGER